MAAAEVQRPLPADHFVARPREHPLSLRSNQGGQLDPTSTGWLEPVQMDVSWADMRARYEKDGYLWVKNVIPREAVLDMREHYFRMLEHTGILRPGTSPRDGVFNDHQDPLLHQGIGARPDDYTLELLNRAHASTFYRDFLSHPALRSFVREFMGWTDELLLDRAMLRHNCPGGQSTGIHYDKLFLRAGEAEFLTAWVPIGDCAADGGGLMYLADSCPLGEDMEADFGRKAQMLSAEERINAFNRHMMQGGYLSQDAKDFAHVQAAESGATRRWLVGDYEAGDVVFHKPFMIHTATRNEDRAGRIRLSSDLRFYENGADLDRRWLKIWTHNDGL